MRKLGIELSSYRYADGSWDKPLLEVGIGGPYAAFGWMYDQMKDASQGIIAGAVAMLTLGQCNYDLLQASNADGAVAVWGTVLGPLGPAWMRCPVGT
ncbi:hypothetical protein [Arthrobacter sp. MA-N2]|uniref:hypothetical protein n=1 Tax=Arthrobacter sp. MA-N2 TaxID=1101188 RepID=UPI00047F97DC|nr:hypothetical protein [Arthrobacter sp. MA-N2]